MSRPSKYSQETAERILSALRAGNTLRASAAYVGISEDTLGNWRKRYSDFSALIARAEAEAEVRYVATVAKAALDSDWRAAMTWLERRRHDDWRERKSADIAVAPIEVTHTVADDSARYLADLIAAGIASGRVSAST